MESDQIQYLFFKIFRNVVINRLIFSYIAGSGKKYYQITDTSFIFKNKYYGLLKDKLNHGFKTFTIIDSDYFDCIKYIDDIETFKLFIKKCKDQNTAKSFKSKDSKYDNDKIPYVDFCANSGKVEFIKYLKESDQFIQDKALDYVCNSGSIECLNYIESVDNSLPITDQSLDNASKGGYVDIVSYLIENKKSVQGKNALNFAIEEGHVEIIKLLESNKPNLVCNHKDSIDKASKSGHYNVIKYLLDKEYQGFSDSSVDNAAIGGHLELVKLLIEIGGYKASSFGLNISSKKNYTELCKYLVDIGTPGDENCIRNSILNGNLELLQYFRDHLPSFKCSPASFNYACYSGNLEMVQYLSKLKVIGTSLAYHDATIQGHLNIIKYLKSSRTDIQCPESAARMSVYHHHRDLIVYYIQCGIADKFKMLQFAQKYNLINMIEFIQNIDI